MRKKHRLLILLLFVMVLAGCAGSPGASAGKIIPPSVQSCPLEGKWAIRQELSGNVEAGAIVHESDAQFTVGAAIFNGQVWENPSYKIKRVKAADYLLTKYIAITGISIPAGREVDIITVYTAGNFFGEFMKIDDGSMVSFVQNKAFLLEKVADRADGSLAEAGPQAPALRADGKQETSGVLVGVRIPEGSGYTYQTLWVAADQQQLRSLLAAGHVFFPRTSGFWELKVQDTTVAGQSANILTARDISTKTLPAQPMVVQSMETPLAQKQPEALLAASPAGRSIMYIGNDYVAIEKESAGLKRLQVLPVDKLAAPAGIKISDLLGDKGLNAYRNAREQAAASLARNGIFEPGTDEFAENFGLTRKNGHWYLVGRINYQSGDTPDYTDFNLNIIPPDNLVFYDTLALSWQHIKDRVPDAVDAFTSPHKNIALIKTRNKLFIYAVAAERLAGKPLAELELPEGAAVIMAEWATGAYVDSWEKAFLAYGAQPVAGVMRR